MELAYLSSNHASLSHHFADTNEVFQACADILNLIGDGIRHVFKESLKAVGIYHPVTNYFYPELHKSDAVEMNTQFAASLSSIENAKEVKSGKVGTLAEERNTALNKSKLILTFKKIEQDVRLSWHTQPIVPHLVAAISILNASTTEEPTVKEWSEVSLLLDTISTCWKKALPENAPLHQQHVTKIIDYIQRYCRLKAGVPAYEKVTSKLAKLRFDEWKLGRSNTQIYSGGLGVATPFSAYGVSAGIGITGAKETIKQTDPEGYYTEYEYWHGGIEGELKTEFSLGIAELKVSLVGSVQGIYGGFREWKTAMSYVTRELETLLKDSKHRTDPDIAPYLSRARLVASESKAPAKPNVDHELLDAYDEVLETPQLKRDFDLIKDEMEQHLSLYLSPLAAEKINAYRTTHRADKDVFVEKYSDKPLVTSSPIELPTGEVVEAGVTGFVVKLVVGAEAKVGLGSEDMNLAAFSVHGSGEWLQRNRKEMKKTPIGERFMDPTKSKNKASIKQQAEARFGVFKGVLTKTLEKESDAYQSSFTDLGMEVLSWARKVGQDQVSENDFIQFLKEKNLDTEKLKTLGRMADTDRRQLILSTPRLGSKRQITDRNFNDENNFKTYFDYLKKDFIEYTKHQNGLLAGKYDNPAQKQKVEKMARQFEACYGAQTPKQLIQRMVYANAYLITQSEDKQLIKDMLEFEQTLLSSSFADDDCYFIEDALIKITDITLELEAKAALPGITGMIKPVCKFGVAYNKMEHTNELRTGETINFTVTIGGEINIKAAVDAIAPEIYKHIPGKFSELALLQLEKELHLIEPTGSYGVEKTYTWSFAKPDVYSEDGSIFSLSKYFRRETDSEIKKMGGKVAIPFGVCDLKLGAEYLNHNIVPSKDINGSNTVFQFGIIFENAVHIGAINRTTGVIERGSRYALYMKEQDQAFQQLCINYGKECDDEIDGPLSQELNAIEAAIERNNTNYLNQLLLIYQNACKTASDKQAANDRLSLLNNAISQRMHSNQLAGELAMFNFAQAKKNFQEAAERFKLDPSLINKTNAWDRFNKLMLAYYPQWIERKTASACYTARPLAEVEDAKAMLADRIQLDKARLLGIMSPYGVV